MRLLIILFALGACGSEPPVERPDEQEQQRLDDIEAMLEQPGNQTD